MTAGGFFLKERNMRHKWTVTRTIPATDDYPETAIEWRCPCGMAKRLRPDKRVRYIKAGHEWSLAPPCERQEAT
jgi:hypothetical protein